MEFIAELSDMPTVAEEKKDLVEESQMEKKDQDPGDLSQTGAEGEKMGKEDWDLLTEWNQLYMASRSRRSVRTWWLTTSKSGCRWTQT